MLSWLLYLLVCTIVTILIVVLMERFILLKIPKKERIRIPFLHKIGICIFNYLLIGMLSVTGIPSVLGIRWDRQGGLNLIPFSDIAGSSFQYIQNIILFVPFGFLFPLLWKSCESVKKVILTGFLFSAAIELSQLFNYRATDVDDLIMNTLGTAVGYCLFRIIKMILSKKIIYVRVGTTLFLKNEGYLCIGIAWFYMIFLDPFISQRFYY